MALILNGSLSSLSLDGGNLGFEIAES